MTVKVDSGEPETHLLNASQEVRTEMSDGGTFKAAHAPRQRKRTGLRQPFKTLGQAR